MSINRGNYEIVSFRAVGDWVSVDLYISSVQLPDILRVHRHKIKELGYHSLHPAYVFENILMQQGPEDN